MRYVQEIQSTRLRKFNHISHMREALLVQNMELSIEFNITLNY